MLGRRDTDREAGRLLTEIYREHAAGAYRYAYHLTRSREDADDILQTVFLALHQSLLRGETIMSPGAFLATAVKRRVINLAARRRAEPDSDRVEETAAPNGGTEAAADLARIQALLYSLPEPQHQAFVLRHWSGLSNREIAGVMATTEPAVESLLVRARSALIAAAAPDRECAEVCARLAQDRPTSAADAGHTSTCRSCRTAHDRLRRAAEIAGAAALVPNLHVAHALAASVPGFSAAAAAGASGAGASGAVATAAGSKAGTAVLLAKTGAALVAVTAVTAIGIHAHRWTRSEQAAVPQHLTVSPPARSASPATAGGDRTAALPAHAAASGETGFIAKTRHAKAAAMEGRDGSTAGATRTTSGDENSGANGDSSGGTDLAGGSGDTSAGGGDSGTASGSDGSGTGTGSDGGGGDSSPGQRGDGSPGGSSDNSGSGPGDSTGS